MNDFKNDNKKLSYGTPPDYLAYVLPEKMSKTGKKGSYADIPYTKFD